MAKLSGQACVGVLSSTLPVPCTSCNAPSARFICISNTRATAAQRLLAWVPVCTHRCINTHVRAYRILRVLSIHPHCPQAKQPKYMSPQAPSWPALHCPLSIVARCWLYPVPLPSSLPSILVSSAFPILITLLCTDYYYYIHTIQLLCTALSRAISLPAACFVWVRLPPPLPFSPFLVSPVA